MPTPGSTSRGATTAATALLGAGVIAIVLLAPAQLRAGLYKYERADGSILLTNERRPELELVEVVSGDAPGSSSGTDSSDRKSAQARETDDEESHDGDGAGESARASEPNVGPLRRNRFDDLIREASQTYDVPFAFIKAVIRVESDFTPDAVSHAGAQGLMQLMPATAGELNVTDPFDPRQNVFGGTKLLRRLIDRYDGDINLILAAYNAGGGAVAEYDGIPYRKTRQYVASVYRWYKHYSGRTDGGEE